VYVVSYIRVCRGTRARAHTHGERERERREREGEREKEREKERECVCVCEDARTRARAHTHTRRRSRCSRGWPRQPRTTNGKFTESSLYYKCTRLVLVLPLILVPTPFELVQTALVLVRPLCIQENSGTII
jgi:hypothetical protein